jgi:hypothetical protein
MNMILIWLARGDLVRTRTQSILNWLSLSSTDSAKAKLGSSRRLAFNTITMTTTDSLQYSYRGQGGTSRRVHTRSILPSLLICWRENQKTMKKRKDFSSRFWPVFKS